MMQVALFLHTTTTPKSKSHQSPSSRLPKLKLSSHMRMRMHRALPIAHHTHPNTTRNTPLPSHYHYNTTSTRQVPSHRSRIHHQNTSHRNSNDNARPPGHGRPAPTAPRASPYRCSPSDLLRPRHPHIHPRSYSPRWRWTSQEGRRRAQPPRQARREEGSQETRNPRG